MNAILTVFFVLFIQVIAFLFAKIQSNQKDSLDSYYLGGRQVSLAYLTVSIISLLFGGGLIVGAAEEAYKFGWIFSIYPLGICIGLILIGCYFGKMLKKLNISTVSEIFEIKYQSQELKNLASLISASSLFFILIAQMVASKKFMFSCGLDSNLLFLIFWSLVFVYVISGGFEAIVKASVIQTAFLAGALVLAVFFILMAGESIQLPEFKIPDSTHELKPSTILSWLIAPVLFLAISQDIAQRSFAAKSDSVVFKAYIIAGVILFLLSLIPIFLGVQGNFLGITKGEKGSILLETLLITTSPFVASLVSSGVIIAITSSAGSLINAISSNISQGFRLDLYLSKQTVTRGVSFLVAITALFSSFCFNNTVYILLFGYEVLVSSLFVSVFMGLLTDKGSAVSAFYSMVAGALAFIYFHFFCISLWVPTELSSVFISLVFFSLGEAQYYLFKVYKKKYTY